MTLKEHIRIFRRGAKICLSFSKTYFVCSVFNIALEALIPFVPIYFSAKLIDALAAHSPLGTLALYAALTVGLVFILKVVSSFIGKKRDVLVDMFWCGENWKLSEKALELPYEALEDPEVSRQKFRVKRESQTGFNIYYLMSALTGMVEQSVKIMTSLAMTVSFFTIRSVSIPVKSGLVLGILLAAAVSVITTKRRQDRQNRLMGEANEFNAFDEIYAEYTRSYGAGKDIRLYGMADWLSDIVFDNSMKFWKLSSGNEYRDALESIPETAVNHALKFAVYAVLIFAALAGEITVGSIAKFVSCITIFIGGMSELTRYVILAFNNDRYLKRYFEYFDIPNNMYRGSLTVEKRDDYDYNVEFKDVSFKYPGTEAWALRHVSLKFKIGQKLAIVGENGSGKTTFIKLLCRLYDPTEGEISLNGVNIKKYDYDEYMSVFSVVFQDFRLFSFRLGEVVASSRDYDSERVRDSLIKANFGDRLRTLPDGVDTYLYKNFSDRGVEISGGEAQKIALARALYRDAPFILLDEPTAALDPVSEYEVYSNFNRTSGSATAVYISHRLASCRFCDKIAVFDGGRIVQSGTHEELYREGGKYRHLWDRQAEYYVKEEKEFQPCSQSS